MGSAYAAFIADRGAPPPIRGASIIDNGDPRQPCSDLPIAVLGLRNHLSTQRLLRDAKNAKEAGRTPADFFEFGGDNASPSDAR